MTSIRITKTMAIDAACELAEKAFSGKIDELNQKLAQKVTEIAIKYIPSPVLACAKEYGDYLGVGRYAVVRKRVVDSCGQEHISGYISSDVNIPIPSPCCYIMVNDVDYNEVEKMKNKINSVKDEKGSFCDKVYNALIALRTLKKVEEEFPEAVKYIKVPMQKSLPSPILSDLRNIISNIA